MKTRNMYYSGLALLLFVAAISAGVYQLKERGTVAPVVTPSPTPTVVALPVLEVYENDYMKVTTPNSWRVAEVGQSGETGKTGAVNITKGNHILYIHPNVSQASGVTGGRFAEIAMGAPSADAVVTEQPSPPCGKSVNGGVVTISGVAITRNDLYVDSTEQDEYCTVPASGVRWYFSYLADARGGYINYYNEGAAPGYVITMAYNSTDVATLPAEKTEQLTAALAEMTDIVKTLVLKQLVK